MPQNSTRFSSVIEVDPSYDPKSIVTFSGVIYFYVALTIATLGSLVNIAVLANPTFKDSVYKILLTISIADLAYAIMEIILSVMMPVCGPSPLLCGSTGQYVALFLIILFSDYLTSSCAIYGIVAEIFLTLQRIFLIQNAKYMRNVTVRQVGPIIGVFSLVYYAPVWLNFQVKPTGRQFFYKNVTYAEMGYSSTEFGNSVAGKWIVSSLNIFRIFLVMVVLFALNIVSIVCFHKYVERKAKLLKKSSASTNPSTKNGPAVAENGAQKRASKSKSSESQASRNITLMLIATSFLYVCGTTPYMLASIGIYIGLNQYDTTFTNIAIFVLFVYPGLKVFVFMKFNRDFYQQVQKYLKIWLVHT